jgi:cell division protein FtsI (penicillin-binding protein 3)
VDDVRRYAEGNVMARTHLETRRGDILDRNGVTLATSLRADSVSADPRWILPPNFKPEKAKEEPEIGAALVDGAEPEPTTTEPKKRDKSKPKTLAFDSPQAKTLRETVARRIAEATGTPAQELLDKVSKPNGFVYLVHHVDDKASKALHKLQAEGHLPGVTVEPEFVRYYPNNALAGALVGRDNQTGSIEASFDNLLRGQQVELRTYKDSSATKMYFDGAPDSGVYGGKSLVLTIDEKIQAVAEHHLDAAVHEFEADFGLAIVMDVQTGEVLAMAVSPSLNPNDTNDKPKFGWHNIAIENQYEPGSTFKVFTLAAGLQEKAVTLEQIIDTSAHLQIGSKAIKDDHPHSQVSGLQALQVSSNIAMAKIAMRLPREKFHKYLTDLGFGRRIDLGVIGEGAGQLAPPDKWSLIQFANIAFGQGIAVTPLQMVAAYATVANGGMYRRPRLIRDELSPDRRHDRLFQVEAGRRVFDEETSKKVLKAMASVCQPKEQYGGPPGSLGGTGTAARMPSYSIGGKTGTAQQANATGGYSDTHWVGSFIGVTPIEKPRLVVFVALDTPKKFDPKLGKIARYGGIVAAPVVREIARFALPYLGVPPSPGAPYLDKNDPEKARQQDSQRLALAQKAADMLVKKDQPPSQKPEVASPDQPALVAGEVRVPDLRRLPMRTAREKLSALGLTLQAHGSGIGVVQGPLPGSIVVKGTSVVVTFKRLSEVAEIVQPVAVNP